MFRLLFIQFIRSKTAIIALALIFTTGIISLFIGKQFLVKQEKTIAAVTKFQQEHIERNAHLNKDNFGLLMYYLRFGLINKPEQLAGLSIGQRDVNLSVQSVTIRALEAQKYDTDLNNPYNLLSGNLDLSFVVIYLFPLLIIVFTFNLLSEEKEGGTWQLVTAQSASSIKYLLAKLAVRAVTVVIVLVLLLLLSLPILSIQWNKAFTLFAATCICYLIFWITLCFLFVRFKKSSGFNAVALLSSWVLLTALLPAGINNIITNKYPVPEALQTIIKNRDGYHNKWDVDKSITISKFYELYPQFKKYSLPDKTFSWLWYYAMWHMGDHDAMQDAKEMRSKLLQREKASRTVAAFIPTMHTQL
ncbi:MAG TPA: ABC transporter permease subunit, partial [Chitinophagaceae bacterium]|nr:ABC transporter permease subunit [Chitinophagaceae bacterium]